MDREAAARAIEAFLRALGHDPERTLELAGTGERVARAWADELLAGYAVDVDALLAAQRLPRHHRSSSSSAPSPCPRSARTT